MEPTCPLPPQLKQVAVTQTLSVPGSPRPDSAPLPPRFLLRQFDADASQAIHPRLPAAKEPIPLPPRTPHFSLLIPIPLNTLLFLPPIRNQLINQLINQPIYLQKLFKCTPYYMLQLKAHYVPLVRFLKQQGLRFKTITVDGSPLEYFRVDQLQQLLDEKCTTIKQNKQSNHIQCNQQVKKIIDQTKWQDVLDFYQREEGTPKYKWPDQLIKMDLNQQSSDSHQKVNKQANNQKKALLINSQFKFASFKFSTISEKSKIIPFCIAGFVISIIFFSVWPYWLKYLVFWSLFSLLGLIIAIIFLRLVIYFFGMGLGRSIWLFPNLFQQGPFLSSFLPIINQKQWIRDFYDFTLQIGAIIIMAFAIWGTIYDDSSFGSSWKAIVQLSKDILKFGDLFAKGQTNIFANALTNSKS